MSIFRYWWLFLVVGFFVYIVFIKEPTPSKPIEEPINLKQILNITADTLYTFEKMSGQIFETSTSYTEEDKDIAAMWAFIDEYKVALNQAQPEIHNTQIGVQPNQDASFLAFEDLNNDDEWDDSTEEPLFLVEIDQAQSRLIASSNYGTVEEYRTSGLSGFFAGYFISSLLNRQSAAGVTSQQLSKKKPVSAKAAARARAGSGSYKTGK